MFKTVFFFLAIILAASAKKDVDRRLQTLAPIAVVPVVVPVAAPIAVPVVVPVAAPITATAKGGGSKGFGKGGGGSKGYYTPSATTGGIYTKGAKMSKKTYTNSDRGYRLYQGAERRMQVR